MQSHGLRKYGIISELKASTDVDYATESLRRLGYAVVDGGYTTTELASFSEAFDRARARSTDELGGPETLAAVDEHNTIRLPLAYEPMFLKLAANVTVLQICKRLIAEYIILNQQNGVINPPRGERYNQGAWHRDLPYQHFVSSRPLAINALFCVDQFTVKNGATQVLPASHKQEEFPSERFVHASANTVEAPAGTFIMLDCMLYHSGGSNRTEYARRAVNHVYTIPMFQQQIHMRSALGDDFVTDAALRKLLGFDVSRPNSISEFISARRSK